MRSFSTLLNLYLAHRKLSGNQFAKLAGSSQSLVSAAQRGKKAPPPNRLKKWANLLLLEGDDLAEFLYVGKRTKVVLGLRKQVKPTFEELISELESESDQAAQLLAEIAAEARPHLKHELYQRAIALAKTLKAKRQ